MRPLLLSLTLALPLAAGVTGWTSWRGPLQTGASLESGLPAKTEPGGELWTYELKGAGTPVIADGLLYAFGFTGGTGEEVREKLVCLDAVNGEKKWEKQFSDYISDIVYSRYGIGSPIVDPETGNVYLQLSNGRCVAFTRDGEPLWERSLMEELGRLTFPNGRTGSAAIFQHLVIFHCVTANWGTNGPAQDRFYAFDKKTGELVWYSSPGLRPVDSAFSMPVFGKLDGRDVFYAGTGCGHVVCVNAHTGEPVWRFLLSQGGVNAQVLLHGEDKLIAVHGKENTDASTKGRMVCLQLPTEYPDEQLVLGPEAEVWRNNDPVAFTSSPILADGRVFSTIATGELLCIDADSGKTLWSEKLAPDQIHASPTYGDGKLYVPMFDGAFYVLKPGDDKAEHLYEHKFEEACLGAPAIWAGKVYLITKERLHCWGPAEGSYVVAAASGDPEPGSKPDDTITQLQIVPAEFALKPGDSQSFTVFGLNAAGHRVKEVTPETWEAFIPPTAMVKAKVDATFEGSTLKAAEDAKLSAGAFKATVGDLSATTRGRVVAGYGYEADFEDVELTMKSETDPDEAVNFPPLPWLGARIKWHVLERDGSKVLANRLDNVLFQRTMNFFGAVDMNDYVLEGDVMTDGNRRIMSTVGFVNQRYLVNLVGNSQVLEVSSNYDRVRASTKFRIKPNTWYRLKSWVERNDDGTGTVHAKAWPRDEDEPADWTLSVPVKHCHPHGAPAVFAFSPQSQKRVYIDNIKITKK
ncbi:PQQ-binding-like beta-propeller repeat protein [Haloferula sp. A504]|uniref:outer membrane protein assembly factor BamB family protein n=1 Tax=Haloferula sp. A504 TaxID=3373601 RepID=UPI0031BFFCB8|nr:PQQ-binding-like beta-propeller repeat protein [Verrucomicrobiaceae bacterium E54]